jgi:hypothetical protein
MLTGRTIGRGFAWQKLRRRAQAIIFFISGDKKGFSCRSENYNLSKQEIDLAMKEWDGE